MKNGVPPNLQSNYLISWWVITGSNLDPLIKSYRSILYFQDVIA